MRYILDNEGYVELCSATKIECNGRGCTEYTGKVPTGYSTIEEWANKANIRAYKIVDGNLVLDANRDYKLRIIFDEEAYTNGYVTRKEMGIASTEEINPYTDLFPSHQSAGGYITSVSEEFNKVGNLPTEEVNLSILEEQNLDLIELEFIGNNFLPNTAMSSSNNGITYTQNKDKTINVRGIATDRSILSLAGTDTSVRNVLTFKANESYLLFGLEGLNLEFYHYDGSNRTLVGIYNGGVISFEEDTNVTQVVLVVDKGTTVSTTISPMLQLVGLEYPVLPMTKNKSNLFDINSTNKYVPSGTNHTINGNSINVSGTWYVGFLIDVEANTDYTLSFDRVINVAKVNTGLWNIYNSSINTKIYAGGSKTEGTFNTGNNTKVYILLYCGAGADNQGDVTFSNIQLEKGTVATPYKEYDGKDGWYYVDGVSTQATRSGDKNLLKGLSTPISDTNYWSSTTQPYFTPLEDGWGKFNYDNTNGSSTVFINAKVKLNAVKLKENTTYTLVTEIRNSNISENSNAFLQMVTNNPTIAFQQAKSLGYSSINQGGIFKTTSITKESFSGVDCAIDTYLRLAAGTKGTVEARISLLEGDIDITNFEYEAYGASPSPDYPSEIINIYKAGTYNAIADNRVYTITIDDDLRSVPNGVADRLWINPAGTFDIDKKTSEVILNGSETNWVQAALNGIVYFYINLSDSIKSSSIITNLLSNYFKPNRNNAIDGFYLYNNNLIIFNNGIATTLDEFKTWLSTHNTEVSYELDTYTTTSGGTTYDTYEYEEYKNNTTLIDLAGNEFTIEDKITIKDNQIILSKGYTEIYLGDTVMPRTYTPFTHAYCHQKVYIDFVYKDPRNVDITKINLKGLILVTDVESEYNFTTTDLTKIQNHIMGIKLLTTDEAEVYDINGDGVVNSYDYVLVSGMINGTISNKIAGELEINSTQSKRTIVLRDNEGNILTSVGLNGISTPSLSVNGVLVEENIGSSGTPTTTLLNGKRVYKRLYTGTMPSTTAGVNSVLVNLDFEFGEAWIDESLSYLTRSDATVPTSFYYSDNDYLRLWIDKTNPPHIRVRAGTDYSSFKYNVVVAYTEYDGTEPETPTEDIVVVNKASTITGSTSSSNWTFKTVATEEKVDRVNKTSTVTVTNYIGRPSTNSSSYFMGNLTNTYKCAGQTYSETVYKNSGTVSAGGWYKLGSRTFTVKHTTEPMTINVGGSMSTSDFNPSSASASGSVKLTEI